MEWDPSKMNVRERYQMLTDCVIPRPIAWVTSLSKLGVLNLAPFSYFNAVASDPMALSIAIARQRDGLEKDTALNLRETGEAVLQLATLTHLNAVDRSGAFFEREVSEVEVLGLETLPSRHVKAPRLKESGVAFEVRLLNTLPVGDLSKPGATELFVVEVVWVHMASHLCKDGVFQPKAWFDLGVLARLGQLGYATSKLVTEADLDEA